MDNYQQPGQGQGQQQQPPDHQQQYPQPGQQQQSQQQSQQQGAPPQYQPNGSGTQQGQVGSSYQPPQQGAPTWAAQPQQSPFQGGQAYQPNTTYQPPPTQDARWYGQQQNQGYQGGGPTPTMPTAQAPSNMPSVEQLGLQGGGDPSNVQNLMRALSMVGAGGNNAAMMGLGSSAPPPTQGPLLGAPAAYTGSMGQTSYGGLYAPSSNSAATGVIAPVNGGSSGVPAPGGWVPGSLPSDQGGSSPYSYTGQGDPFAPGPQPAMSANQNQNNNGGAAAAAAPPPYLVSDERAKTDIAPGGAKVRSLLETIGSHEYSYKDPADGRGRFFGPMAQELAATEVGRSAVIETPRGLMVDGGRLAAINMSAAKDLHERVKMLEKGAKL